MKAWLAVLAVLSVSPAFPGESAVSPDGSSRGDGRVEVVSGDRMLVATPGGQGVVLRAGIGPAGRELARIVPYGKGSGSGASEAVGGAAGSAEGGAAGSAREPSAEPPRPSSSRRAG